MYIKKFDPRAEYRQQENQRVQDSPSLAAEFPGLKSLTVNLAHFDSGGSRKASEMKYTVNLAHARARFRFYCASPECVGGDFDLSDELAKAIAAHLETATGEVRCRGWRSKTSIDRVHCENLLRFELSIGY